MQSPDGQGRLQARHHLGPSGLAVKEPNPQRKFQVVALGSIRELHGVKRGAPCLGEDGDRRELGLRWFDGAGLATIGSLAFASIRTFWSLCSCTLILRT